MPDRLLRTAHGATGGLLILVGAYMTLLGGLWHLIPTETRDAGIEWVNRSVIPVNGLDDAHVAWVWIISGVLIIIGGAVSQCSRAERAAIALAIFTPLVVAGLFVGAWIDGSAPAAITSAVHYAFPAGIIIWQVSHERHRVERGDVSTMTETMEVVR